MTTTTTPDPAEVEQLLAISEERDLWLRRLHSAEREAFERGRAFGHDEGLAQAERDMARRWQEVARPTARGGPKHAELEERRWGPGGREHFADPKPGDCGPGEAERRAAASWRSLGTGPGPGWVHLGGRTVHHHHPCTAACEAYRPGWYTIEAAIAIIETLPGDYAETIASLLASVRTTGRRAA